ncbi:hypothetical protein PL9214290539 [Planktothrix tepida PCC 9214]|uniref:Uncharacterized protein n=1 Tax=Planktothrix tepida PCC 9214 TaxID=671072 RepID=A0A1J1LGB9_9CYAN|nr:hypothetical protein PL9214290539 [Planktothrix tepida PCC 9214]
MSIIILIPYFCLSNMKSTYERYISSTVNEAQILKGHWGI